MFQHPKNPLSLIHYDALGNGECAGIAQADPGGVPGLIPRLIPGSNPQRYYPRVSDWIRGAPVKGRPVPPGTVIAIFDSNGVYVGQDHHKFKKLGIAHTALYVRQSQEGIEVVHQFGGKHTKINGTLIRFGGGWLGQACSPERADGYHHSAVSGVNTDRKGIQPEDDADNYYVVELRPDHQLRYSGTVGTLNRSA